MLRMLPIMAILDVFGCYELLMTCFWMLQTLDATALDASIRSQKCQVGTGTQQRNVIKKICPNATRSG